jgi:hypothetical protein
MAIAENFIHMQKQVFFFERLKREVGAIPTRSRHCKWEQAAEATVRDVWEGAASIDHEPGDLPDSYAPINLRG